MGFYLEGPTFGKTQYILSEHGGHRTTLEDIIMGDAFSKTQEEVIVCVVENQQFEAAAVIPPIPFEFLLEQREFQKWAYDQRPKTWLMIPWKNIPEGIKKALCRA